MKKTYSLIIALLSAYASWSQSMDSKDSLYIKMGFFEGKWISTSYVGKRGDRQIKSGRKYFFEAGRKALVLQGFGVLDNGDTTEVDLIGLTMYNSVTAKFLSTGAFGHGGVIEPWNYTTMEDNVWVGYFDYTFQRNRTKWKLIEKIIGPEEFIEEAYMWKDDEWLHVNTIRYIKTD